MPFSPLTFEKDLDKALSTFDKATATTLVTGFMEFLCQSEQQVPTRTLERTLQVLRNKRLFHLMQRLGDCCIQLGLETGKIRRQYAQALIDQGIYAGALGILRQLKADTAAQPLGAEHIEATGLIGRVYKQQYVNCAGSQHPRIAGLLYQAIESYREAYDRDREHHLWHGINLVALLCRATKDGLGLTGLPEAGPIAEAVLARVQDLEAEGKAYPWDLATACEACIALNRPDEALEWTKRYITSPADAFELGSTLRQYQEVWQLTMQDPVGALILPPLSAALLQRDGATLTITPEDLEKQKRPDPAYVKKLERVLGPEDFQTYQWFVNGLQTCTAVARIGSTAARGFGTGFLLDGARLCETLGGRMLLFTNAHIISDNPRINNGSLYADEAVVTLEAVDKALELKLDAIVKSSPVADLDTTVLTFDKASQAQLDALCANIRAFPLAKRMPRTDGKQRVYIIGHPYGGGLTISIHDSIFLAHNHRLMHYRTPTDGGSSGSPVFNDEWELIGIHHGGGILQKLDDPKQTYQANEGICFAAIQTLFA